MNRVRTSRGGFTLLEVLGVVVIIGILATIMIVAVRGHVAQTRVTAARTHIVQMAGAVDAFYIQQGFYPASLGDLVTRPAKVAENRWPEGGYLRRVQNDPWRNAYEYRQPGQQGAYDIICYGSDGAPGGTGDAADITNHDTGE